MFVVGLTAELLVEGGPRARDPLPEDGVVAVGADALDRMHRRGVAQCDVISEVVGLETVRALSIPALISLQIGITSL